MNERVVLITGAGSGIGAALAHRLARAGTHLCLHTGANEVALADVADKARACGVNVATLFGDLGAEGHATDLIAHTVQEFGRLDGLVSNAGFADRTAVEEVDLNALHRSFDAMAAAFLQLMQAAAPMLQESPAGRAVAVSSFVAHRFNLGGDNFTASAVAKAGLEALVRSLAHKLAAQSVTVNAVIPGYIRKDAEIDHASPHLSARRTGMNQVPMGRVGLPEEVAAAIAFLLSVDASYITGESIHVDGGMML